jgi:hypothetical protein
MYTNERISDLEARWSRRSCRISSGVTMLPTPTGAALEAAFAQGEGPRPECLFDAGILQARGARPRSRSNGSAVSWADVGRARPGP